MFWMTAMLIRLQASSTTRKESAPQPKEDRLVYQCIQRAVNVLKNQFNEDHQRAFTKNCRGFVRLYEFLSMASSFGDPELHKNMCLSTCC